VDNYRRFQTLAEEYVTHSDEITRREFQNSGVKKNPMPAQILASQSQEGFGFLKLAPCRVLALEFFFYARVLELPPSNFIAVGDVLLGEGFEKRR